MRQSFLEYVIDTGIIILKESRQQLMNLTIYLSII